jgi:hypothetical protein
MSENACNTLTPSQCVVEQKAFYLVRKLTQTQEPIPDLQILYHRSHINGFRFRLLGFLTALLFSLGLPFFQLLLSSGLPLLRFQTVLKLFLILELDFPNDEAYILGE